MNITTSIHLSINDNAMHHSIHQATTLTTSLTKTTSPRKSSFAPRISRTLHEPALPPAQNSKKVVIRLQTFEHAPRASVPAHRKQRKGRHSPREFRRRSTRQRHDSPKHREGRRLCQEFRRRSMRQRHDGAENFKDAPRASVTTRPEHREIPRGSSFAPRISRTLHARAQFWATHRQHREGRHSRR